MLELKLISIKEFPVSKELLDVFFGDKKVLKQELSSLVIFNNETGELSVPFLNEQKTLGVTKLKTKKGHLHPRGFRLVKSEPEVSMFGFIDVTLRATCIVDRMIKDKRNPDVKVIVEVSVHFVFEEKTGKWYKVDLTNENHVSTKLYLEKKEQEKALEESYSNDYDDHLKLLSSMEDIEYRYNNKDEILAVFKGFRAYHSGLPEVLNMYHFFKWVTPIEKIYVKKYSAAVLELVNSTEELLVKELKKYGDDFETVLSINKELKGKIIKSLDEIKFFFCGRKEENADNQDLIGYRGTLYFVSELKERRELIPNVMEIETRRYFETEFWSDRDESEYLENLKKYAFGKP